jgi:hypothetical protein
MPEIIRRKTTVTVEFTEQGTETYGESADKAVKSIEAIPGARVTNVQVTRQ